MGDNGGRSDKDKKRPQQQGKKGGGQFFKGLDPDLPVLIYDENGNMSHRVQVFFDKMRIYCRAAGYFPDLDNVFKIDDPSYPEIEFPERPDEDADQYDKLEYTEEFKMAKHEEKQLERDKIKLHGVLLGQMSESSKNRLKSTASGMLSMENKKLLTLVKEIRASHLGVGIVAPDIEFYAAKKAFENLKMDEGGNLDRYKEIFDAGSARLRAAAEMAGTEYTERMPNDKMMATQFIMNLAPKYGAYVKKVVRGEKSLPSTVKDALDDIVKHGVEYDNTYRRDRAYVTQGGKRGGHSGAGRGGNSRSGSGQGGRGRGERGEPSDSVGADARAHKVVAGVDGQIHERIKCSYDECGNYGHYMRMCPFRAGRAAQKLAEEDRSIEKAVAGKAKTVEFTNVGGGSLKAGGGAAGSN